MKARAFITPLLRPLWLLVGVVAVSGAGCQGTSAERQPAVLEGVQPSVAVAAAPADSAFARLVARLSEPGGYFDTDNLISNEASYQHVLGAMRAREVRGGAYFGVGPDQNFTYIAQVRPALAFIVDIRRDNLLQHVFFKALFAEARTRVEYLCLLFGKPAPPDADAWRERGIAQVVAYLDAAPSSRADAARAAVKAQARQAGLPLSDADLAFIDRIHTQFIQGGLDLQFSSHGREPWSYYPTYRQLLLEEDLTGRQGAFLVREDDFQFVKTMQAQDRIVPVVGDLAGDHALVAIGQYLAEQGEVVSAFYTSNVEFYLMRRGGFDRFVENVRRLPRDDRSVIVRSYFNRFASGHPHTVPGYASTQLLQTVESLVEEYDRGGYQSYRDLIHKHLIDAR